MLKSQKARLLSLIHIFNRVASDDAVLEEAKKLAAKIAKRGPVAVRLSLIHI